MKARVWRSVTIIGPRWVCHVPTYGQIVFRWESYPTWQEAMDAVQPNIREHCPRQSDYTLENDGGQR